METDHGHLVDSAIVLRRVEFGDYDLILTLFSRSLGKISAIAKNAKKSRRRFPGRLELFSVIHPKLSSPKNGGMPVLQEVVLTAPMEGLRTDFIRMGVAAYWSEILLVWLEDAAPQPGLYDLFQDVLHALNAAVGPPEALSLLFQLRFLATAGLAPGLAACCHCQTPIHAFPSGRIRFDFARGGILCGHCAAGGRSAALSPGTVKALRWVQDALDAHAGRMRFSRQATSEGLAFLETFLSYHLGREFRSLRYLRSVQSAL